MPEARYHGIATSALGATLAAAAPLLIDRAGYASLALIPGVLTGLAMHPDLDQWRKSRSLWHIWWNIYAKAMPHRSPWSHWPVIGTTIRLAWISIPLLAGGALFGALLGLSMPSLPLELAPAAVWWVIGLALADALHGLMDWIL